MENLSPKTFESKKSVENAEQIGKYSDQSENQGKYKRWRIFTEQHTTQIMNTNKNDQSFNSKPDETGLMNKNPRYSGKLEQPTKNKSHFPWKLMTGDEKIDKKSQSRNISQENLDFRLNGFTRTLKLYVRRFAASLSMILCILSMALISFWHRINTFLKATAVRVVQINAAFISLLVEVTPRKLFKRVMIYFCYITPSLRYRSIMLFVLNSAPSRTTKAVVRAYLRRVPAWVMAWQAQLLLRGSSSFSKIIRNLGEVVRLPATLLETVFVTTAGLLGALSKTLTFSGKHSTKTIFKRVSSSELKLTNSCQTHPEKLEQAAKSKKSFLKLMTSDKKCPFEKISQDGLDARRAGPSWNPKLYIKRITSSLSMILNILSTTLEPFWHKINTTLKSRESRILHISRASTSWLIEITCVKKIFSILCQVLHLPITLLEAVLKAPAGATNSPCRSVTFSRSSSVHGVRRHLSSSSWKLKGRRDSVSSDLEECQQTLW